MIVFVTHNLYWKHHICDFILDALLWAAMTFVHTCSHTVGHTLCTTIGQDTVCRSGPDDPNEHENNVVKNIFILTSEIG